MVREILEPTFKQDRNASNNTLFVILFLTYPLYEILVKYRLNCTFGLLGIAFVQFLSPRFQLC